MPSRPSRAARPPLSRPSRPGAQTVAKLTSEVPSAAAVPDLKDTIGDPVVIVDSVYDFAKELIDLNKAFVHQMLEASQTTTDKVTTKPPAKAASKA